MDLLAILSDVRFYFISGLRIFKQISRHTWKFHSIFCVIEKFKCSGLGLHEFFGLPSRTTGGIGVGHFSKKMIGKISGKGGS